MKTIREKTEFALARLGMALIPKFSRRTILALSKGFGITAYYLSRHLRHVGVSNLSIVFGTRKTPAEKKRILQQSFITFALTLLDLFWFSQKQERLRDYIHFDSSYARLREGKPIILLTGHIGNWEIGGRAVHTVDVDLVSVAAPLANPQVNKLFNDLRTDSGQTVVSKNGAVRKMLQTLKNNGNIALLLDQNTKPCRGGIFVDFFELPVPISTAAATLLLHTEARLIFGTCMPDQKGHYVCGALQEIDVEGFKNLPKKQATLAMTQAIAQTIEAHIKAYPESWVWTYKRWKYVAPGKTLADYPFYAKQMEEIDLIALDKFEARS